MEVVIQEGVSRVDLKTVFDFLAEREINSVLVEGGATTGGTLQYKLGADGTYGTAIPTAAEVSRMLDLAEGLLRRRDYSPYYLYRQKYMSGGFENVGWTRPGHENLYNICVMEELRSVVSMGAGASTKLTVGDGRLQRMLSPKYPKEYMEGIGKVCAEKDRIPLFYRSIESSGAESSEESR